MGDHGGYCGNENVKGTMNVVPLELMTQLMNQRINSAVYGKAITHVAQSVEWLTQLGDRRLDPALDCSQSPYSFRHSPQSALSFTNQDGGSSIEAHQS